MTDDIDAFLRDRLKEDTETAHAAMWDEHSGSWTARPPETRHERYTVEDYCDDGVVIVAPENADPDGVGRHVARWDPERVLAEVDAKRRMLDVHRRVHRRSTGSAGGINEDCAICDHFPAQYPCGTLRLLALPYAAHPDYQEAWRP
ncbi:DUF6221 family protein [Streptomyces jumonjinensis]|uniref:Uncharacterized protein n=1 Tax=Streptomyces jumonjinensis TaxID=1945 RepID=A0A646KNQ4_STRJU|nr:DUF6221 family protein [Streptomyces jumonjinensis]MQT03873.1 hypothetical protein [Streptomyces jumonjinensis]